MSWIWSRWDNRKYANIRFICIGRCLIGPMPSYIWCIMAASDTGYLILTELGRFRMSWFGSGWDNRKMANTRLICIGRCLIGPMPAYTWCLWQHRTLSVTVTLDIRSWTKVACFRMSWTGSGLDNRKWEDIRFRCIGRCPIGPMPAYIGSIDPNHTIPTDTHTPKHTKSALSQCPITATKDWWADSTYKNRTLWHHWT